jgi:hypothetical protein
MHSLLFALWCVGTPLGLLATGPIVAAQAPTPRPAVAAIVEALRAHAVVAIGELHGSRRVGDFYLQLVRDPSFQRAVNDIVVEFASGQSQSLLDRYVRRGFVAHGECSLDLA